MCAMSGSRHKVSRSVCVSMSEVPRTRSPVVPDGRDGITLALGFAAAAALGVFSLGRPLYGDQALFVVGAKQLLHGDALYIDFWDLKQPGIYWWYAAAGRIAGFREAGLHAVELLWQLATALVLLALVRPSLQHPRLAAFVPLATTGLYYATAGTGSLTQVESLIALPLLLSILAFRLSERRARYRWALLLAAGSAGSIVLIFKLLYAPMVASIWLALLILTARGHRRGVSRVIVGGAWLSVGLMAPLLVTLLAVSQGGHLGYVLHTWFVVPPRIAALPDMRTANALSTGVRQFALSYAPCIALAAFAVVARLRRNGDPLDLAFVVWIVTGIGMILSDFWWAYLWMHIVVPVGALAVLGLDELVSQFPRRYSGRVKQGFALLLSGGLLLSVGPLLVAGSVWRSQLTALVQHGLHGPEKYRQKYYSEAATDLKRLNKSMAARSMTVLGNPTILYLANQDQAIPLNGWSPEIFLPEHCLSLKEQLSARPPDVVFVSSKFWLNVRRRCGQAYDPVSHYRILTSTPRGAWFKSTM